MHTPCRVLKDVLNTGVGTLVLQKTKGDLLIHGAKTKYSIFDE